MNLIRRQTSYFSRAICDQTSGHTKYQKVPNERYGQDLSTDALISLCWLSELAAAASQNQTFFLETIKNAENGQLVGNSLRVYVIYERPQV